MGKGLGHMLYGVDDIYGLCAKLEKVGCRCLSQNQGPIGWQHRYRFCADPDGYSHELIAQGLTIKVEWWSLRLLSYVSRSFSGRHV